MSGGSGDMFNRGGCVYRLIHMLIVINIYAIYFNVVL